MICGIHARWPVENGSGQSFDWPSSISTTLRGDSERPLNQSRHKSEYFNDVTENGLCCGVWMHYAIFEIDAWRRR